ncbi:DMT family transporter [Thalassolituus sp.]|uniref:DMT family transporter n=1 Tax=Thalassolituus sp. TaxID=2030822 RepID=UPI0035112FD1
MQLISAYLMVVLIWSSTPVAIQFSLTGLEFFTALSLRMWASAVLSLLLVAAFRQRLALSRQALVSYVAGSVGIYGAMMAVYWGAAYIPSGLISVIYGLAPMLAGALGYVWLKERELTPARIIALLIALCGLAVVVSARTSLDGLAWRGIAGALLSVIFFAVSAVWVKQANAGLHPVVQTSGTLWVSSLMYLITVPVFGFHWPETWQPQAIGAISYLVICGSLLAFVLYFYILRHLPTSRVTLITLMAPALAMLWGYILKDERLQLSTFAGALVLLSGLAMYQWHHGFDRFLRKIARGVTKKEQKSTTECP